MSDGDVISIEAMQRHLTRVLNSPSFETSPRMKRFLRFLCDEYFAGRGAALKELILAVEVFDKPHDFDTGSNAVVRVEAGRLRRLLSRYHVEHGNQDELILSVPKGSYIPQFERAAKDANTHCADEVRVGSLHGSDESRLVTVVACALDDELSNDHRDYFSRFDAAYEVCVAIAEQHGGAIDASASDRLIIYFGWPNPLEDMAGRAMTAALDIIATLRSNPTPGITARIGIAAGEVFIRTKAEGQLPTIVGQTPALATRLLVDLPSNNILVTESVRRLSGSAFELLPAGTKEAAHDPATIVWRLLRPRMIKTRFRAKRNALQLPIVGRSEELALLVSRWHLAVEGEGQVVIVEGDAGIGKSRLCEAALSSLPRKSSQIRVQCSPHHSNRALYPVIAFLHRVTGHHDKDGSDMDALGRFLARFALDQPVNRSLLADILFQSNSDSTVTLPANRRKEATLELLLRLMTLHVETKATVLLVEDIHWADPTTIELIERMISLTEHMGLLLLITSRPGSALARRSVFTSLQLSRLSRNASNEMIERIVASAPIGVDARNAILEKAEGVPLYLEELTKLFLANDERAFGADSIPESINDLLASQLGRIGPARDVAQVAAVIGRAFSPELVSAVMGVESGLVEAAFDQLVAAAIFVPASQEGRHTFSFRHALLRDAAYTSLLDTDRRKLHARVGTTLIDSFPELAADHPEIVADHMKQAGHLDRAVTFWIEAGRKASSRHELNEAIVDFRAALDALSHIPDQPDTLERELEALLLLGLAIRNAHGYFEAELRPTYERARTLAADLNRPEALASAIYGLWTHSAGLGRWPEARILADEFQQLARAIEDDGQFEIEALRLLGASAAFSGELGVARLHFERAFQLYDPSRHGPRLGYDPGAVAAAYLSWTLWHLGDVDEAARAADRALEIADREGDPSTTALVLAWLIFHAVCAKDYDRVISLNEQLQVICSERECRYWRPFGNACLEWALFQQDPDGDRLVRLIGYARQFTEHYLAACLLLLAADMCLALARAEEGLALTAEAKHLIDTNGERIWEAEERRCTGQLKLLLDPPDTRGAVLCFRSALRIARQQGALSLTHRAAQLLATVEK